MTYKRFVASQSIIMMAGSMVFPFYILLLRNVGDSFSQFGWAYGLFALTSALFYPLIGKISDKFGDKKLLIIYAWSMAVLMLLFPIATEVWHVYILQIMMGCLGAVQRNTEKTSLARKVESKEAGYEIGKYHVWTSIGGAVAVIATGYLVDFLTIGSIFYIASVLYMVSGVVIGRQK
ncbi:MULTISPECIES: MFS transporter [Bacillus cereus group]|uniref:MFS transporter n=1 Tax=Bacillus cereus group TaxID=86661 RepID=UPI00030C0524|nr:MULTISPECIES: MFS transporter [Bacillus cereus group]PFA22216.1 MFS transporter [Bacillus cereus]PFR24878.1 MFS transporter [Bacillus cereus]PGZ12581.1 MFS transporter [Bacillus cereus]